MGIGHEPYIEPREVAAEPYVTREDRYVVTFAVGYDAVDADMEGNGGALGAAALALDLTRDGGSAETVWHVYDRETGTMHRFEQAEFEDTSTPA